MAEDRYQEALEKSVETKKNIAVSPTVFDNLSDRGILLLIGIILVLGYVGTYGFDKGPQAVEFNMNRCVNLGNNILRCDWVNPMQPNYPVGILALLLVGGVLYLRKGAQLQPVLLEEEAKVITKRLLKNKQSRADWEVPDGDIQVELECKHREWGYRTITGEAKKFPWYWTVPFTIREVSGRKRSFIAQINSGGPAIGTPKAILEVTYFTPEPDVIYQYVPVDTMLAYGKLAMYKKKGGFIKS